MIRCVVIDMNKLLYLKLIILFKFIPFKITIIFIRDVVIIIGQFVEKNEGMSVYIKVYEV